MIVRRRTGGWKISATETRRSSPAAVRAALSSAQARDSPKNAMMTINGRITPAPATKNSVRQSGRNIPDSTAATAPPIGKLLSTNAAARPRDWLGQDSTTYADTTAQTPPSPNPAMNRSSRNSSKFGTTASAAVKTPNVAREATNAVLRPKLSDTYPTT